MLTTFLQIRQILLSHDFKLLQTCIILIRTNIVNFINIYGRALCVVVSEQMG